jgi:hypothetical protein
MRCVLGIAALLLIAGAGHGSETDLVATLSETVDEPMGTAATPALASSGSASEPRFLFFSGLDAWPSGAFAHVGLLWSPAGLYREGFTLKALGDVGTYRYRAGRADGTEVTGQQAVGALMPGWRFKWDRLELTAYGGVDVQQHRLFPADAGSRVRGLHVGARVGTDLWYEPLPELMVAANASLSSIGPSYWTRAATGWRLLDRFWLGPEAVALGDTQYLQYRIGLHATGLRTGNFEWSAGGGWVADSDRREGVYARLGLITRR